jgi:hypothetical protein
MTQLAMTAMDNKNLFSNYYLDNQLKNNPEWKKEEHKAAFSEIKKLYETEKDFIPTLNEKQLEQRFFGPIFKILNHTVEVNEGTEMGEFPDYAFFPDKNSLDDSHKKKGTISFYNNSFAIGEGKRWGIELDRFGKDEKDRKRNPSLQIWIYLHDVTPKWGILSNGAKWRLYCKERRRDDYYEVDLPTLIATNDIENFKYFYYFFRRDAFLPSKDGRNFLDDVLKGSADYAKDIGNDLKENVYKAMKKVAEGFFNWPENRLDVTNEGARDKIQKNTMILLYRLLFLLYAEGKGLLNLRDIRYESYSFDKLKKMVKEKQDGPVQGRYMPIGMELLSRLKSLFRLINQGSEALGIPKNEFYVPAYNGGLFDPEKHPELEKWIIGDLFLADAIDLLSRSRIIGGGKGFVDYSTLEIRHLGSIYEGLLEYKLQVADEDMVVNGGEWVKLEEFNKDRKQKKVFSDFDEFDRVKKGQIFLATDKGERKATGSYYTPDYIVNYIVKNTVGPVVDEKWKEAESNKKSFIDATLSVTVLDPAMGSGHFLVGSIEYLSDRLLKAAQEDINAGRLREESHLTHDWARREVVAHCIYGVDMNPMAVELAKVGLWLTTISNTKPLSFLDHRLKQGNSLIGARLSELKNYPDLVSKKRDKDQTTLPSFVSPIFIKHLIGKIAELEKINDESLEDIKKKEKVFGEFKQLPEYRKAKAIANVYTAVYFGNEVDPTEKKNSSNVYHDLFWAIMGEENEWRKKTNRDWFIKANQITLDKSFFHWELEFPEIFFEGGAPKENPGWDAVVGNPPYGALFDLQTKEYFIKQYSAVEYQFESFTLFIERALELLSRSGFHSYITPTTWLSEHYYGKLRTFVFTNNKLLQVVFFKEHVFGEATVETCIEIIQKTLPTQASIINLGVIFSNPQKFEGRWSEIEQNRIESFEGKRITEYLTPEVLTVYEKTKKNSEPLKNISKMVVGIKPYQTGKGKPSQTKSIVENRIYDANYKRDETFKPYLRGEDFHRYNLINTKSRWISYGDWLAEPRPSAPFLEPKKIIIRQTADSIIAAIDDTKCLNLNNVHNLVLINNEYSLHFILTILNSKFFSFMHRIIVPEFGRVFAEVKIVNLEKLTVRHISFTTPPDRRAALSADAKALYSEFLGAPDSIKILELVCKRLEASPEESDVVQDLLAYLAERMIEMNKEKNVEIKSFLDFLKGEIGASIEDLTNKTAIQEYYRHEFQNLIDMFVKNKKKLKAGYEPKSPTNYKLLQQWYNDSTVRLKPLMGRIKATDGLIDQIVYKLYGLTEDEIKIVEGSGNMNVKAEVKAS